MTQYNRPNLLTDIINYIYTNVVNYITGNRLQTRLTNIVDSTPNILSDKDQANGYVGTNASNEMIANYYRESITATNLFTKADNGTLVVNKGYLVTNANSNTKKIGVIANTVASIYPTGIDLQNGVVGLYDINTGTFTSTNALIETLTNSAFQTLITNSELVSGKYYLVTGAFTSTVFATDWDILCIADSVNTVLSQAWIMNSGQTPIACEYDPATPLVKVNYGNFKTITPTIANTWSSLSPYETFAQTKMTVLTGGGSYIELSVSDDPVVLLFKDARNMGDGKFGQYFPATDTFVPNDGEYTPTLAGDGSVVTAASPSTDFEYTRVGDRLFISGQIEVDVDFGGGTEGTISYNLPSALFTSASENGGFSIDIGSSTPNQPIYGYVKNGRVYIQCHDNSFNGTIFITIWIHIKLS